MADRINRAVEVVGRAIHEHDANASMSGVQWPEWDDLNAEGQFAYVPVATDVLEALDAAGLLITPERDAAVAERAWDEGFTRGFYSGASGLYGPASDASEPDVTNPYERTDQTP